MSPIKTQRFEISQQIENVMKGQQSMEEKKKKKPRKLDLPKKQMRKFLRFIRNVYEAHIQMYYIT